MGPLPVLATPEPRSVSGLKDPLVLSRRRLTIPQLSSVAAATSASVVRFAALADAHQEHVS